MSPKVPKAYLDARREEIINAAFKCFADKGLHNTTMQDIYEATDLSPGAVYNYFSGKDDIVAGAVKMFSDASVASIEKVLKNSKEPLLSVFEYWFRTSLQGDLRPYFGVEMEFYAAAARNEIIRDAIIKSMDDTGRRLVGMVKQNQQNGRLNPRLDPLSIAHAMVGMIFTAAIHKMIEPGFDLENYRKVWVAMLTGTFAVTAAKRAKTPQVKLKRRPPKK